MRQRKKYTKITALSLGVVALVALTAFGPRAYGWLWIEWHVGDALEELREHTGPGGLGAEPLPVWRSVVEARQRGFPVVTGVLRETDDGRLLAGVWESIGRLADEDYWKELWQYLQDTDSETFLRFFVLRAKPEQPYQVGVSGGALVFELPDYWPHHWHRPDEVRLQPTDPAVRFCEAVLHGNVLDGVDRDRHAYYRARAIDGLSAMLRPRKLPTPDAGDDQLEPRIVDLLSRISREEAGGELGFHTVRRLVERSELSFTGVGPHLLESWWCLAHLDYRAHPALLGMLGDFNAIDAASVVALVYLDRVETLDVLVRLYPRPEAREVIDAILRDGNPSLPFPPPKWVPFHEAAGRFLKRTRRDRLYASLLLAELGKVEGVPMLEAAIELESDPELRILYKAGLVALGGREHLEAVRSVMAKRAAGSAAGAAQSRNDLTGIEGAHVLWNPASWNAEPGSVEAHPRDLARLLLWGGDRNTLDIVLEQWLADKSEEPAVELDLVLESWPFGADIDDYRMVRARLGGTGFDLSPPPGESAKLPDLSVVGSALTSGS